MSMSIDVSSPQRVARMQALYRRFMRERLKRRKAGGGYDARSSRGLQALGFADHNLPHHFHHAFLKKILLADIPVSYIWENGVNAFHAAAQLGNMKVLENIISLGVSKKTITSRGKLDPRRRSKDGMSAIHFAALADRDDPAIMSKVLDTMLLTVANEDLALPTEISELKPREQSVVQVVLQKSRHGLNVLGYCSLSGNKDMMIYLLQQIGCAGEDGKVLPEKSPLAKYILEQNVTCNGSYQRLQHVVCYNADPWTLKILIDCGVELNGVTDGDGKNVYHHLAGSWRASADVRLRATFDILKEQLATLQPNPMNSRTTHEGQTALHLACNAGVTTIIRLLIDAIESSSLSQRDASGATPVMLLLRHRFKAREQMELLSNILSSFEVSPDSRDGVEGVNTESLPTWWNEHKCSQTGRSLAVKACEWRNIAALNIVLDAAVATAVDDADDDGKTPLHHCCESGWREGIEALVLRGASLSAQDKEGSTPLMLSP